MTGLSYFKAMLTIPLSTNSTGYGLHCIGTPVALHGGMTPRGKEDEMTTTTTIDARTTGYRDCLGTRWPIETTLERRGPRQWIVTRGLCNGVPESVEKYSTRRAALVAFGCEEV